jgi:paraquat-inducible protein B
MSKQADRTVIGAFVIGALLLVLAGVYFFGSGTFLNKTTRFVLYFEESVQGLSVGAPVVFKGVKIGSVSDINLHMCVDDYTFRTEVAIETHDRIIPVGEEATLQKHFARVDSAEDKTRGEIIELLVEKGLRARLELQSMVTGQLMVAFDFFPDKPPRIAKCTSEYPQLPTAPSGMQEITTAIEKIPIEQIIADFLSALQGIERMVNSPETANSMAALHQAIEDLKSLIAGMNDRIEPLGDNIHTMVVEFRDMARNVNEKITPLAEGITETLDDTRRLVRRVDGRIDPLADSMTETLHDAGDLVRNVNGKLTPLGEAIEALLEEARGALAQTARTLTLIQDVAGEKSALRFQVMETLSDLSGAADSIKAMADYIEQHPESLLQGKNGN